ncbi:MAG: flagellar basal-body rod protein FlgF [Bacteriovoracaceae bacterium]|nr:flagellar basal-body rod protein FlgF [Bacteriovoracaceae bacterium]
MKNIWVPLSGQIAQQRKVDTIANNIANANTAGFKKDRLTFKEHLSALNKGLDDIDIPRKDWSPDDMYRTQGGQNAYVKVDGSYTIFEQGQLRPTKNPLDIALFGKGFFEVLTPTGIRYTRKGTFSLDKQGHLTTNAGYKVLGKSDDPNIKPEDRFISLSNANKVSISKSGDIFTQEGLIGGLSVVEFNDHQALKKEGGSLFYNDNKDNTFKQDITTTVNQGFLEGSNVNAVQEMSELIKAHRHFDNIQKAIKTYDDISGKAVNDIARF